jgi:hypothetical protein
VIGFQEEVASSSCSAFSSQSEQTTENLSNSAALSEAAEMPPTSPRGGLGKLIGAGRTAVKAAVAAVLTGPSCAAWLLLAQVPPCWQASCQSPPTGVRATHPLSELLNSPSACTKQRVRAGISLFPNTTADHHASTCADMCWCTCFLTCPQQTFLQVLHKSWSMWQSASQLSTATWSRKSRCVLTQQQELAGHSCDCAGWVMALVW